jgi:Domain of unknown function (DUF4247)
MTRSKMLILAGVLAIASVICLVFGITTARTVQSYIEDHYQNVGNNTYRCDGSPSDVADDLAEAHTPQARATDDDNYYLRYSDSIVIVGPGSGHGCSLRPGSPSHSSGGSSGGPGGVK